MYTSRDLGDLLPCVRERAISHIAQAEMEIRGLKLIVCCTLRDKEAQDELYKIGRRGVVGEKTVTDAKGGESIHQYRMAYDVFPLLHGKSVFTQKDGDEVSDPLWQRIGAIGKKYNLKWGGDFKKRDGPHFEYTGGLTFEQIKAGQTPKV